MILLSFLFGTVALNVRHFDMLLNTTASAPISPNAAEAITKE